MNNEDRYRWHLSQCRLYRSKYSREITRQGLRNMPASYQLHRRTNRARALQAIYRRHLELSYTC